MSEGQSWIGMALIRLLSVPFILLWKLLKQDWKEQDEKKKQEQSSRTGQTPQQ